MPRLLPLAMIALATSASAIERLEIARPGLDPLRVELFVARPDGAGPFPVILFAHGHQSAPRPGGRVFITLDRRPALATVDEGRLTAMRDRGWIAVAISLPGYGGTPGPSDFWGPRSQAALRTALDHLPSLPGADPRRMALYGVSGGAATASVVAAGRTDLRALVLVAGMYDLASFYPTNEPGMDGQIEADAGTTPLAFASRSGLSSASRISAATLLLHGGADRASTVAQAEAMARSIAAAGGSARAVIFPGVPHAIPIALQWQEIDPFLDGMIAR